jgi:SAM-dependent methyltransferase
MTAIDVSDPLPVELYERALAGQAVGVQLEDGTRVSLTTGMWSRPRPGDDSVIDRCRGATLDVGCGSGRFTQALLQVGVPALGIDVSPHAVRLTRGRGAAALHQDVFDRRSTLGRWQHVLLTDGNIGIGGDADALLRRCRELVCPGGSVLVEVAAPGTGCRTVMVRLVHAHRPSRPFRWSVSDGPGIKAIGAGVGLVAADEWMAGGRWFVELTSTDE